VSNRSKSSPFALMLRLSDIAGCLHVLRMTVSEMTKFRELLLGSIVVTLTVISVVIVSEIALRFLPVATGIRTIPVTEQQPVFRFAPNQTFVYSRDWNMRLANTGRINNAGFVSDHPYRANGNFPLVAVIGDSMVEAAMVPFAETISARLARALSPIRVYSFGASGAPLSQYLIWARHAVRDYGATALVIVVVGNDFDESLWSYASSPGFWRYAPNDSDELQLRLLDYRPGRFRDLVYASALARYLVFNLQVGNFRSPIFLGRYAGNTSADASPERLRDSVAAINAFLRDLPSYSELPPSRVMFLVDGMRYREVAAAQAGSYFATMRTTFIDLARQQGYGAIDLDDQFFRQDDERFEFVNDGHWNSAGHRVACKAALTASTLIQIRSVTSGACD